MDIGQPKDYLTGMCLHLHSLRKHSPASLASGPAGQYRGDVIVHPTARVEEGAVLGPNVVVGAGCVVERGARIVRSTLLDGVRVKAHAYVSSAIVGWGGTVGCWARVDGAVLGADVQVADEVSLNGTIILPHKGIRENHLVPGTIVM